MNLAEVDGRWLLSATAEPVPVYPGRAARRAPLRLTWPIPLIAAAGTVPALGIELSNVSDRPWANEPEDSAHIRGWLLDSDGQRIEESPWFAFGHGAPLPNLGPGKTVLLPVTFATPDLDALPPGEYPIEATAVALNLRSSVGSLRVA